MEAGNLTSEIRNQINAINVDEFKPHPNHTPLPYKDGAPITRDTFTSWLIRGFAISRGDPAVQYGYIRWSSAKTRHDFHSTLDNFVKSGAGKCLSDEENQLVIILPTYFPRGRKPREVVNSRMF